jgi:hypothetical protein
MKSYEVELHVSGRKEHHASIKSGEAMRIQKKKHAYAVTYQ